MDCEITIRPAVLDDVPSIARVHVDTWRSAYAGIMPQEFLDSLCYEQREQSWRTGLSNPDWKCRLVAAHPQHGVVGFVAGGKDRDRSPEFDGELYAIYVSKQCQGLGIGQALTRKFVEWLIANTYRTMRVWVLKDNHPSRKFYEAVGGTLLSAEKELEFGGKKLVEVAYSWRDLPATIRVLIGESSS